jgi:hypothetical protein
VNVLELRNAEMGVYRVRLLRKGESDGLKHQLIYDKDEPTVEFYGPTAEGEQPEDAPFLYRDYASHFLRPRNEWLTLELGGYCGISPENSREIADWLARELEQPWTPPPPPPPPPSQARANRPIELHETGDRRITLYMRGLFGYEKREAQWAQVYCAPHAQYADAIFVEFLPRRARQPRRIILGSRPHVVILLGWDHPELQEWLVPIGGPVVDQVHLPVKGLMTKYTSADPGYDQEFESALAEYLANLPLTQLLLDLRGETVTERWRPRSAHRQPIAQSVIPVLERSGVRLTGTAPDEPVPMCSWLTPRPRVAPWSTWSSTCRGRGPGTGAGWRRRRSRQFRTKPQFLKLMIRRAAAAGVPFRWVTANEAYGDNGPLRDFLEKEKSLRCWRSPAITSSRRPRGRAVRTSWPPPDRGTASAAGTARRAAARIPDPLSMRSL